MSVISIFLMIVLMNLDSISPKRVQDGVNAGAAAVSTQFLKKGVMLLHLINDKHPPTVREIGDVTQTLS